MIHNWNTTINSYITVYFCELSYFFHKFILSINYKSSIALTWGSMAWYSSALESISLDYDWYRTKIKLLISNVVLDLRLSQYRKRVFQDGCIYHHIRCRIGSTINISFKRNYNTKYSLHTCKYVCHLHICQTVKIIHKQVCY